MRIDRNYGYTVNSVRILAEPGVYLPPAVLLLPLRPAIVPPVAPVHAVASDIPRAADEKLRRHINCSLLA